MKRLSDRAAFEQYAAEARARWERLWSEDQWVISVGISGCSIAKGALETYRNLSLHLSEGHIPAVLRQVGCGGWCFAEPFVEVKLPGHPPIVYGWMTTDRVPELLDALRRGDLRPDWALGVRAAGAWHGIPPLTEHPFLRRQRRLLLEHAGIIDPESIEDYIAIGGYRAFLKALFEMTPEEVIAEVKASNLRGPGWSRVPDRNQMGKRAPHAGATKICGRQ
jgi:hypothetical protein